jgi:hypothetical protein
MFGKEKYEIGREPPQVPADLLIEMLCRDAQQRRKIRVQNCAVAAKLEDSACGIGKGRKGKGAVGWHSLCTGDSLRFNQRKAPEKR